MVAVPNCLVHSLLPVESYFAKNASLEPALVPSKLPNVNPVIYTLLFESIATPRARSSTLVPNCLVQSRMYGSDIFIQ